MSRVEAAKRLVWDLWKPVRGNRAGGGLGPVGPLGAVATDPSAADRSRRAGQLRGGPLRDLATDRFAADLEFHGPAPWGRLDGRDPWRDQWLGAIERAFPRVERQAYLFLGGEFEGQTWVAETGEWQGVMAGDIGGVPATGRFERLRYGAFHRVVDGAVVEMRVLIDLLALAAAAGFELLPEFPARGALPPAPAANNGVVLDAQDRAVTAETLQLVEDMLGGCNRLVDGELRSMGMHAYWHDDMCWYGPWGVGSTIGFDEFQRWAQGPSVSSFPNRRGGFHQARFADGVTAAFTGWPSLQGTFDGVAFRGIEPTGGPIGQNIMDFYVRRGPLLAENWVLIDLVDFAAQCGVDLLDQLPGDR